MGRHGLIAVLFVVILASPALVLAEEEVGCEPGQRAPEISATTWLNTPEGESPFSGDAEPRLVLLEFWGTWCGPCVRSMPKVQGVWDRYRSHGLLVVAMTREAAGEVRKFLEDNAYTMPVACDPSQSCIGQFEIDGWPTTYLIDRDGRVVWRGDPYGVEPEIEKALGLEGSPKTLLTQCLDAEARGVKDAVRPVLDRLVAKAPVAFDLVDWAGTALGEAPPAVEAPAKLSAKDALKHLDKVRAGWKDAEKRKALLVSLASAEAEAVDLGAWVRAWFVKAFPLGADDVKKLLSEKRYSELVDAFLLHDPSAGLYKLASKDEGLQSFVGKTQKEAFVFARKGLMGLTYWMADGPPPEGFDADAFSNDLSVSGVAMNKERNAILGIMIGGDMVMKDVMGAWIDRQLGRGFVMDALSAGQPLGGAKLAKKVEEERARILKALRKQYG